jgi:alanine dehydrogenase
MTIVLDNQDVIASIDMPRLVEIQEDGFRAELQGDVHTVPRINLPAPPSGFFRVMPVVMPALDVMGLKAFNGDASVGVRYMVALWSVSSGELLALIDACYLTAARTGAVTAVATRAMTRGRDTDVIGIIGSGLEARTNLEAICAVCDVRQAKVYSPNSERCRRFADEMSGRLQIQVEPVSRAQDAADAPVVLVATNTGNNSGIVALQGGWLRSAGHVSTIGSTMPALREVDGETFGRADLVVLDTEHAHGESGDLQAAVAEGHWDNGKVRGLAEYLGNDATVSDERPALTVFKSVGTAVQDIVAAKAVYETALEKGRGREVNFLAPKFF